MDWAPHVSILVDCLWWKRTKQTSSPKQPAVQQIAVGKDAPDLPCSLDASVKEVIRL